MIKKLYSISVYDYVNMLCKEMGVLWPGPTKDLYMGLDNNIDIAKSKRKK